MKQKQSEQLLNIAKTAVEKTIETNENYAGTYINAQLEILNLNDE